MQAAKPFFLMAGPNVIQSQEHIFKMCREIKAVTDECAAGCRAAASVCFAANLAPHSSDSILAALAVSQARHRVRVQVQL